MTALNSPASQQSRAPEYAGGDRQDRERAAEPNSGRAVVETGTQARQGVTGHNARYVLAISLSAVVLAFAAIYAVFWG